MDRAAEDDCFERAVKEDIYGNLERPSLTEVVGGHIHYYPLTMQSHAPSVNHLNICSFTQDLAAHHHVSLQ